MDVSIPGNYQKKGEPVDFYLSATRNQKAAKHFLGKALNNIKPYKHSNTLNTDKDKAGNRAIKTLILQKVLMG